MSYQQIYSAISQFRIRNYFTISYHRSVFIRHSQYIRCHPYSIRIITFRCRTDYCRAFSNKDNITRFNINRRNIQIRTTVRNLYIKLIHQFRFNKFLTFLCRIRCLRKSQFRVLFLRSFFSRYGYCRNSTAFAGSRPIAAKRQSAYPYGISYRKRIIIQCTARRRYRSYFRCPYLY